MSAALACRCYPVRLVVDGLAPHGRFAQILLPRLPVPYGAQGSARQAFCFCFLNVCVFAPYLAVAGALRPSLALLAPTVQTPYIPCPLICARESSEYAAE